MTSDTPYTRHYPISWDQLHRDSRALAWRLLDLGPFNRLVVVTRGGLVPAAVVARELGLHTIDTVCITSYDWQKQGQATILKRVEGDGQGDLIIDDLVDTGSTAQVVRSMLPKAHLATVYAKPAGRPHVDTFITEVSQDTWILFPWDSEGQYVKPLAERRPDK